jgi:D-glutamate N-acetyltransferase
MLEMAPFTYIPTPLTARKMTAPRHLIIADGDFGPMTSKTANSIIRYHPERTVAVLDRQHAGRSVEDVLGFGGAIPVVGSMREGLAFGPTAVLIGIAPKGGQLPAEWRAWLGEAIDAGCDIWNGLHNFLSDDPMLAAKARAKGRTLHDLRRPPANLPIASGLAKAVDPLVVLTVGTDCNVGKMTAQLQLIRKLNERGVRARFVPTGQTGIMIEGWGIAVDAVVADFIAGAAEWLTLEGSKNADVVLVEGQGSINHPGYSGVTLGLLHGSCPDAMILCHQSTREFIGDYREAAWLRIPPLAEYVRLYESIAAPVHPARVIGISLNTYDLSDVEARRACDRAEEETGLPATDPVRFDSAPLVNAIADERNRYLRTSKAL